VAIDYGPDGKANAIYPRKLPALYRGTEFMLVGRFKGSGPGHITVTGSVAGEQRQIQLDVNWPAREVDNAYLPRVWAMRKIGHLMEDLRLHGNNAEIVQELVTLAQRHGIVTPYTSQLVVEPGFNQGQPQPVTTPPVRRNREDDTFGAADAPSFKGDYKAMNGHEALAMQDRKSSGSVEAAKQVQQFAQNTNSGEVAVALATVERELKDADKAGDGLTLEGKYGPAAAAKPNAPVDKKGKEEAYRQIGAAMRAGQAGGGGRYEDGQLARPSSDAQDEELGEKFDRAQTAIIKQVGDRTFYNRGGVWVDSSAKADAKPTIVKLFSAEYFELVKNDSTLGPVLALGSKIIVVSMDKTYQIEE
jgi:Ca-activated chloride channel family protein